MKDFGLNIIKLEFSIIKSKTINFLKRNYVRIRRTSAYIWEELKHIGHGFVALKDDIKEGVAETKEFHYTKYRKPTYTQTKKIQKITRDVIKFIPFSFFIIIPGLELLLPAWLMIFPNSIPSQFQSIAARQKKIDDLLVKRNQAAEKLIYKLPIYLSKLKDAKAENAKSTKSYLMTEEEKAETDRLLKLLGTDKAVNSELLTFKHLFIKYVDFRHFKVATLQDFANFMGLQPITGFNIINNMLSFVGLKVKIDNKYVSWLTKRILVRELRLCLRKIRREDSYLYWEKVENLEENKLDMICLERGIEIVNKSRETKLKDYKMWQAMSNLNNVSDTLLIFCRLNDFADDLYRKSTAVEEETTFLHPRGSDQNFALKKKKLEQYLEMAAIKDKIDKLIESGKLTVNDDLSILDNEVLIKLQNQYNNSEEANEDNERHTPEEKDKIRRAYNEFELRHNTIASQQKVIVAEMDKLLEELEQLIVI